MSETQSDEALEQKISEAKAAADQAVSYGQDIVAAHLYSEMICLQRLRRPEIAETMDRARLERCRSA